MRYWCVHGCLYIRIPPRYFKNMESVRIIREYTYLKWRDILW